MPEGAEKQANEKGAAISGRLDPYRAYSFGIDIGSGIQGFFTSCSGLHVQVEAIEYRSAGGDLGGVKIPGQVRYQPVSLRYGLTSSPELWQWFTTAINGQVEHRTVGIVMLDPSDPTGKRPPVLRWDLFNAWICEWRGAPLDTLAQEIAIETVTLAFDRLERQ